MDDAVTTPPGDLRAETRLLLELRRLEGTVIRAALAEPEAVAPRVVRRLRYLLGFAALTRLRPGDRAELQVGDELAPLRERVLAELGDPLREQSRPADRLKHAELVLERLLEPVDHARTQLLERHPVSPAELDAEAGAKTLVSVAGGGGGAGFVYIGAYQRLEEAGIVPALTVGASIGALIGLYRARTRRPPWGDHIELAKSLDRRTLFSPLQVSRRHGLPGLLSLRLEPSLGDSFRRPDGSPLRLGDLELGFEAVVAGVRRRSFERLPKRFRLPAAVAGGYRPLARLSPARLPATIALRMWQVAAFFDPRVVKPILLGSDELTRELSALAAAGFSAAIPGVLHYDLEHEDERMHALLDELLEREDVAALIDGGVASNVPAEQAYQQVQAGRLGTRNAFVLAFDCFHPQWDPHHLWLQPITQAVALQRARDEPFADLVLQIEPTLSPVNLVATAAEIDRAVGWGRAAIEEALPQIKSFLEPVTWEAS